MTEAVEINEGWINEMVENGSLASVSDSEEDESIAQTIESLNEETKKRRRVSDMVKKSDPGYHYYYIIKNKIKIKVEVYSTSCNARSLIRCPSGLEKASEDTSLFSLLMEVWSLTGRRTESSRLKPMLHHHTPSM